MPRDPRSFSQFCRLAPILLGGCMHRILTLLGAASATCLMLACGKTSDGSDNPSDLDDNATGGYYDDATGGVPGTGGSPHAGTGGYGNASGGYDNATGGTPGLGGYDNATGGMPGSAGTAGNYYNPDEYGAFAACASPFDCVARLATNDDVYSVISENPECLLSALRDRIPGSYKLDRDANYGDGNSSDSDVFIIAADGVVNHASFHVLYGGTNDPFATTPTQRCELQAPSFFQDCLDAIIGDPEGQMAHDCAQTLGPFEPLPLTWFTSCEPVDYACTRD